MAKQHKAATQVTIAPTEETPLGQLVQRYWMHATAIAVLVVLVILGTTMMRHKSARAQSESWDRLREEVELGGAFGFIQAPPAATLAGLADELVATPAGPWARALEAHKEIEDGDFEAAAETLRRLEEEYPDHPLSSDVLQFREDGAPRELSDYLLDRMDAVSRWEKEREWLFKNPPLPPDCPKVRLNTSKGAIVVGLYQEQAPKHVENFLKLCREGFYNNTLFHRVAPSFMIQGGDPNSRDGEPESWGQGGPDYTIPQEQSELRHFQYVLAAAKKPADVESSGSQFYITAGAPHHLDGQHTIFGAVLDGKSVVDEIAAGEIAEGTTDRPRDPVVLTSTEVIE